MKKFIRMLILMSIMAISPVFAQDIEDVVVTSSILGTKSQIENPIHVIDEETLNKSGSHSSPWYNLPRAHQMLREKGFTDQMEISEGYLPIFKKILIQ